MFKLSKRQSMGLFVTFLMALPIAIQASAPKLLTCGGVILLEEDPIDADEQEGEP